MFEINSSYFKLIMKLNKVKFGKNLKLIGLPIIFRQNNGYLEIGNNCVIKSSFISNLVGLYQRTIIISRDKGKIIIGDNVGISGATIYSREKIEIGSYTNIGGNVKILDNDFHPIDPEARKYDDKSKIKSKEIVIGQNVFIGANSIILKGTRLGKNCVIGAGSVVCGEFPDNVIIAGNPATIIRDIGGK